MGRQTVFVKVWTTQLLSLILPIIGDRSFLNVVFTASVGKCGMNTFTLVRSGNSGWIASAFSVLLLFSCLIVNDSFAQSRSGEKTKANTIEKLEGFVQPSEISPEVRMMVGKNRRRNKAKAFEIQRTGGAVARRALNRASLASLFVSSTFMFITAPPAPIISNQNWPSPAPGSGKAAISGISDICKSSFGNCKILSSYRSTRATR